MNVLFKSLAAASAAAILAVTTLPSVASAGEVSHRVNRQEMRLNQGVRSGELTRGEYRRTDRRLDAIAAQRRRDLRANDGHLTPGERARLNRELNSSSTNIYFDKHDRRDQPGV